MYIEPQENRIDAYTWSRAPRPPPPPNPPPSLLVGGNWVGRDSHLPLPVVWGHPPPSPLWCGVWWGRVRAGKSWWARGGREASLLRQTIFCGRRFCSETLGCPFKCFGRPLRFLSGTIQKGAIKSVLLTSRPPGVDYTLCHNLYTIYARVYTIYYNTIDIFCIHGLFIYDSKTTQRRQSSSSHIASGHLRARLWHTTASYSIVYGTTVYYSLL